MIAAELAKALGGHRAGATWMARCPAHEDRKPSLSISSGKDGKVLVHCHAGCDQRDVIAILRQRGLWETTRKSWGRFARKRQDRVSDEPDADARNAARRRWRSGRHRNRQKERPSQHICARAGSFCRLQVICASIPD